MDEPRFQQYLAELGTVNADRQRELSLPLRGLHQQILEHFASTGRAPAPETFQGWAADVGVAARQALADLKAADLAETDPDTGQILGAYPFAPAPRGHRVDIDGGPAVQAYCAIDALGIPAMLGRDAAITSADPHSGAEVRIQVRGGHATWNPDAAVASMPAGEALAGIAAGMDHPAADAACPTTNFYASAEDARGYQQAHGLTLEILTIPQALRFGSAAFGLLLSPGQQ